MKSEILIKKIRFNHKIGLGQGSEEKLPRPENTEA
jgi:hypothetical protein